MPKPYTVARSATIHAPAATIVELLSDFHHWQQWSPWEDIDPTMTRTYSGADQGVGAHYAWEGNKAAGKGTMTITGVSAAEVDVDLHFDKPFPADNTIEFTLVPSGDATRVTWTMHGQLNFAMRLFSLVKSMDSMVGGDFEKGLRQLKDEAERRAQGTTAQP